MTYSKYVKVIFVEMVLPTYLDFRFMIKLTGTLYLLFNVRSIELCVCSSI